MKCQFPARLIFCLTPAPIIHPISIVRVVMIPAPPPTTLLPPILRLVIASPPSTHIGHTSGITTKRGRIKVPRADNTLQYTSPTKHLPHSTPYFPSFIRPPAQCYYSKCHSSQHLQYPPYQSTQYTFAKENLAYIQPNIILDTA